MSRRLFPILAALALVACASPAPQPTPRPSIASTATAPSSSPIPAGSDACHPTASVPLCQLNPAVSQATIGQTICVAGWTATVRPPVSYTDALKRQQLAQFAGDHPGDPEWSVAGTEEDHRMPLDLGGDPHDPMNLSPEVHRDSGRKDQDEARLGGSQGEVCRGLKTLAQAQAEMAQRWLRVWPGYQA